MAHAAARLDLPLAANCVSAEPGRPVAGRAPALGRQPARGGQRSPGAVKLLTVASVRRRGSGRRPRPPWEPYAPELSEADLAVRVVRREEPPPGTVSLTDATRRRRRRPRRRQRRGLRAAGGARGATRRRRRWLPRRDEPRLASARRSGRPNRREDRTRPLYRLRDQRRDPAHRRLQGREEDPRDQQGPATRRWLARSDYAVVGDLHEVVRGRDRRAAPLTGVSWAGRARRPAQVPDHPVRGWLGVPGGVQGDGRDDQGRQAVREAGRGAANRLTAIPLDSEN